VFVPYTDPGLQLARAIRRRTQAFIKKHGRAPRVILLENHGIIALGRTVEAVLVATLMAEKAAQVWLGAAALGGPKFMTRRHVDRIAGRADEEVRRKTLKM
jgi:ribulose-5-phosphate 4-epimerase/fuculose-1-phosphate aldolase